MNITHENKSNWIVLRWMRNVPFTLNYQTGVVWGLAWWWGVTLCGSLSHSWNLSSRLECFDSLANWYFGFVCKDYLHFKVLSVISLYPCPPSGASGLTLRLPSHITIARCCCIRTQVYSFHQYTGLSILGNRSDKPYPNSFDHPLVHIMQFCVVHRWSMVITEWLVMQSISKQRFDLHSNAVL